MKIPAAAQSDSEESSVLYYRKGSAASAMSPAMLDNPAVATLLAQAGLIHLSCITAALSPECRALLTGILTLPRNGRLVSFDVNWRGALWANEDKAILRTPANQSDVVLVGADEATPAFGTNDTNDTNDEARLRAMLPDPAVIVL